MYQRKIAISSAIICLVALIVAGLFAFQASGDGYYLGWSDGVVKACKEGCPSLSQKDFGMAHTLAAEESEFRNNLEFTWGAFIAALAVAAISALAGLAAAIRCPSKRGGNV